MLLPVIIGGTRNSCGTRPWSDGGGRGELSHHALDNCHEGGTKPSPMGTVRFSGVVPSLLVSALHFRSAPWAFAGGCARSRPKVFSSTWWNTGRLKALTGSKVNSARSCSPHSKTIFRMRLTAYAVLKEEGIRISYSWMQKTPKNAIDSSRSSSFLTAEKMLRMPDGR